MTIMTIMTAGRARQEAAASAVVLLAEASAAAGRQAVPAPLAAADLPEAADPSAAVLQEAAELADIDQTL